MAKTAPFDVYPDRYDAWFDRHEAAYRSELAAIRMLLPDEGKGLEVGVGTGRFAAPLGIRHGVDPSPEMRARARERNIEVKDGTAEDLPYPDERFDFVLLTTTLCFLHDPQQAFREAFRVLRPERKRAPRRKYPWSGSGLGPRPGGALVVGFIDRASPLGRRYEKKRAESDFYRDARFHEAEEVIDLVRRTGFVELATRQTLFGDPETMEEPDPVREGHGEGGFVVLRGLKPP